MKLRPNPTWVVVADQARARLFRYGLQDGGLEEIEDIVHLDARLPVRELIGGCRRSKEQQQTNQNSY